MGVHARPCGLPLSHSMEAAVSVLTRASGTPPAGGGGAGPAGGGWGKGKGCMKGAGGMSSVNFRDG